MTQFQTQAQAAPSYLQPHQAQPHQAQSHQAYVIEIGETQAGLVNRRGDERFFTFIAASAAFDALEGQRFATPIAAERAARQLAVPQRHAGFGHRSRLS